MDLQDIKFFIIFNVIQCILSSKSKNNENIETIIFRIFHNFDLDCKNSFKKQN